MVETVIYTDPLGNSLVLEDGTYIINYPENVDGMIESEELPFQVGDLSHGVNGVTNELMIAAVTHRLERLEEKSPSIFNRLTLALLKGAAFIQDEKHKDEKLRIQFESEKLTEGDLNALDVIRWKTVVAAVQPITSALTAILDTTYRKGSKMRSVDVKRIKHPEIAKLFKK